jgi:hypothetical protein
LLVVAQWFVTFLQKLACSYLLTQTQYRLMVPLPTPLPTSPPRWMGNGAPPFPRRGQGLDQEGFGSWPRSQGRSRGERGPVINLPVTLPVPARVFFGPQRPPQMSAVNLNEVFTDLYKYSAYVSFVLGGLFSVLRNVVLGQFPITVSAVVHNSANGSSLNFQINRSAALNCTLQEIHVNAISAGELVGDEGTQEQRGDSALQPLQVRPHDLPRRRRKAAVPIDTSLLHRSARLEKINQGFNTNSFVSAAASSSANPGKSKESKGKSKMPLNLDGPTYEGHSVPGAAPAPHLSVATVQAIGVGFCKMQPSAVSAAVLHAPFNDDIDQ